MKKIYLVIIFTVLFTSVLPVSISAQEDTTREPERTLSEQQIEENRCNRISLRIDIVAQKHNQGKERYRIRYNAIKNRITTLIDKLDEDGYDITKLNIHLEELNTLIAQFTDKVPALINATSSMKQSACEGDRDGFNTHKNSSTLILTDLKTISKQIKDLVTVTIKDELKSLQK